MSEAQAIRVAMVGFKHFNLPSDFLDSLDRKQITLVAEPSNKHDSNAVKCMVGDFHFGYIEQDNSRLIAGLIENTEALSIRVLEFSEYKAHIEITIERLSISEKSKSDYQFDPIPDGSMPGIYRIVFESEGKKLGYIGQSNDINNRLRSHYRELRDGKHSNIRLQEGWWSDSRSFSHEVLEKCDPTLSALDRQIFLFKREYHWIRNPLGQVETNINILDGDLVFTKDSLKELLEIRGWVLNRIKETQAILRKQKRLVSEIIIELGIINKVENRQAKINSSNVLTWLNKSRYGNLDYRPIIQRSHDLYEPLLVELKGVQEQIRLATSRKKRLETFLESSLRKQNSHETFSPEGMDSFVALLEVMQKPLKVPGGISARYQLRKYLKSEVLSGIARLEAKIQEAIRIFNINLELEDTQNKPGQSSTSGTENIRSEPRLNEQRSSTDKQRSQINPKAKNVDDGESEKEKGIRGFQEVTSLSNSGSLSRSHKRVIDKKTSDVMDSRSEWAQRLKDLPKRSDKQWKQNQTDLPNGYVEFSCPSCREFNRVKSGYLIQCRRCQDSFILAVTPHRSGG